MLQRGVFEDGADDGGAVRGDLAERVAGAFRLVDRIQRRRRWQHDLEPGLKLEAAQAFSDLPQADVKGSPAVGQGCGPAQRSQRADGQPERDAVLTVAWMHGDPVEPTYVEYE